jgi:hypothetical protein
MLKEILFRILPLHQAREALLGFFKVGLFNRQVAKVLMRRFDAFWGQEINYPAGNLGFGFFHYGLVSAIKPKRILCVGSQKGFVPAVCALACKGNNSGHVDFVDAGYQEGHPKAWSGKGFWSRSKANKHFTFILGDGWISSYIMTSKEFVERYPDRRYYYIYIDADHTFEGVQKDYRLLWPLLNKGGFMAFHDIFPKGSFRGKYKFGVWRFWKILSTQKKSFYLPGRSGLGVIQKG